MTTRTRKRKRQPRRQRTPNFESYESYAAYHQDLSKRKRKKAQQLVEQAKFHDLQSGAQPVQKKRRTNPLAAALIILLCIVLLFSLFHYLHNTGNI